MDYAQSKYLLKRIEIPVPVQQRVPFAHAKRRNPAINRLAHGVTLLPKSPEIPRRRDPKTRASCLNNFEAAEFAQDPLEHAFVAIASQNFEQNHVVKSQTLPLEFPSH